MQFFTKLKKLIPIFIFLTSTIFAQNTLQGIVVDSLSQESLVGATVYLVGTSLGSACNIEGEYKVTNIPDGTYQIRVSYVGYKSKFLKLSFKNKQVTELYFQLSPDVIEGKTIVVSAQALGQAAAINQQISSNTIVNVISEQKIKELPDANAAESIGRLPGVSILRSGGEANKVILRGLSDAYTSVTIDGVRIASTDASSRGLDLSTISQNSLAGIELYKALTPDKDADALAGSINLVTRKAPAKREFVTLLKGDYNNLMKSAKQYDFSTKYGERFFDDFLGVQVNGNIERRIRSNEQLDLNYDQTINNQTDYEISDFTVNFTDEIRSRMGGGLILDIPTPDGGTIKFNNVYNSTNRDYLLSNRDYNLGVVTYSYRDREQEINTYNSSITGENYLLDFKLTWGLSYAQSRGDYPYDYYLDFLEPSTSTSGTRAAPRVKTNPEQYVSYAFNNFKAATMYSANYRTQENFEKERSIYLNLSKKYLLEDLFAGELKLGGKYKTKRRFNNATLLYSPYYLGYWQAYERVNGTIKPKDLSGTSFDAFFKRFQQNPLNNTLSFQEFLNTPPESRNIFDLYSLNPLINRDKLKEWYSLNKNGVDKNGSISEYSFDPSLKANFYDVTESVLSGYVMNTFSFGEALIVVAGLRVESEDNDYNSKYSPVITGGFPIPPDITRDTTASHKETIVLPHLHINFKPTDFMSIRLAAYKALARPDFNYRLNSYFGWRPAATSGNKQLILGNPLLKTAQAWNFEINTSFYGNEIGLISLSAFYKEITDMYHQLNALNTQGDVMIKSLGLAWHSLHTGNYQLTVPYNSPDKTKVWGFEFEHQINFNFLPGLWRNIVLSYNASLVKSETFLISSATDTIKYYLPGLPGIPFYRYEDRPVTIKQQLENQPTFYGNISLGYDIAGFSARLSLFHQSEYNLSFSASGRGDQIINPFTRLDLALKQEVTENISLMVNISNLTDIKEENSIYNRVNGYKILNTSERYGVTADFGVKVNL